MRENEKIPAGVLVQKNPLDVSILVLGAIILIILKIVS